MKNIAIGKDAVLLHELLGLKLSCLEPEVCKVGFPILSLEKYTDLIQEKRHSYVVYFFDRQDEDLIWLIKRILFAQLREKGLEIGNYTSQIFANIYLNE